MRQCVFTLIFILGLSAQTLESVLISVDKRIKPLETFYQESLQLIYGKSKTKIDGKKRNAMETYRYLFEDIDDVEPVKMFRVDHLILKETVGLEKNRRFFAYNELSKNDRLNKGISEAIHKARNEIRMTELDDAFLQVNSQLNAFSESLNLFMYKVIPSQNSEWRTIYDAMMSGENFPFREGYTTLLSSILKHQNQNLSNDLLAKRNYELFYNNLLPFRYSWILLSFASIFFFYFKRNGSKTFFHISRIAFIISFILLTAGFILRVLISDRAPVSNMYESVLWCGFAAASFGLFYFFKESNTRQKDLISYSSFAALIFVMASDLLPNVFDSKIQPLQPVLRSNFWLSTHVLTITFSYGAFAVSFIVSVVGIFRHLLNKDFKKSLEQINYSTLKVGTLFLALGTLLGAIWADYAWGRFWGWDPKETWAAITLLIYMIILHGRYSAWIRKELNFAYSTIAFLSVLMAWYGVNYILGVGLHSYGFSKAGNSWFYYLSLIVSFFVVWSILKFRKENNIKVNKNKGLKHAL